MISRSTDDRHWLRGSLLSGSLTLLSASLPNPARSEVAQSTTPAAAGNLLDLPIEQLLDIEITSVGKKPQRLAEAAAAITVITQEDIRRAGMIAVPELLRMVPGLDVAQVDARHWAISSRGFNAVYSAKLLVLVDGRTVYSPVFSGVFWDALAVPLGDIERIEVIRGPGATLWGANAVNGVINIITKNARDTQGPALSLTGGTARAGAVSARYGGSLSEKLDYRIYFDGINYTTFAKPARDDAAVEGRAGVRIDWRPSAADAVSAQGEYFQERTRSVLYLPSLLASPFGAAIVQHNSGGHALVSWDHNFSTTSNIKLQAYYDAATTEDYSSAITVDTFDAELIDRFQVAARNDIVWGAGYRHVDYSSVRNPFIFWTPAVGNQDIYNIFVQDDVTLLPTLHLIGGIKLEHNTYTGWENEPSVRLAWEPAANHTLWAAISRAIRAPSIGERLGSFIIAATPGSARSPPILVGILSNPQQRSERLTSFETGYRGSLSPRVTIDISGFYNLYTDLSSTVAEAPFLVFSPAPPHVFAPLRFGNLLRGETHGGEVAATWQVTPAWNLFAGYSLLLGKIVGDNPALNLTPQPNAIGTSPRYQVQARSHLNLPLRTELDAAVFWVDAVPSEHVAAYTRMDLRVGWRPSSRLSISLAGQNLLRASHREFLPVYFSTAKQVPRTVYLTAAVGF